MSAHWSARDLLVLAAITADGTRAEGALSELEAIAGWIDYVNHDGTTPAELRADLERFAQAGLVSLHDGRFVVSADGLELARHDRRRR